MASSVLYFILFFMAHHLNMNNVNISCTAMELPHTILKRDAPKGQCECGVFDVDSARDKDPPIVNKTAVQVTCDAKGSASCNKLCKTAAEASVMDVLVRVCASVYHFIYIKVSIFSRACKSEEWVYSGVTSEEFCCHDYKPYNCTDLFVD